MLDLAQRLRWAIETSMDTIGEFQRAMDRRLRDTGVDGYSYPAINEYLQGRVSPRHEFLVHAADELGVRLAWLTSGEGPMHEGAPDPDDRREKLRRRIMDAHPGLASLGAHAQELFMGVLTQYALTAPDGLDLAEREDRDDVLVELAADLLFYLQLPIQAGWGFVNAATGREGQVETFNVLMLGALKTIMADRGGGLPLEAVEKSGLRKHRLFEEQKIEELMELLPEFRASRREEE